MTRTFLKLLAAAGLACAGSNAFAQIWLTSTGVTQTLGLEGGPVSGSAIWTNHSMVYGWYHARTGNGTAIVANDGSSDVGNFYSYGSNGDRALGSVGSGDAAIGDMFLGVRLLNLTGVTLTQLDVSYTGEQWRNSGAAAQTIDFSYLIGSPTLTGSLADFQSAGVAVPALNFTSPITGGSAGALDGNLAANRTAITFSITGMNIPHGSEVLLRWSDPDHSGADHGLAIDNFSVTPHNNGGPGAFRFSAPAYVIDEDDGIADITVFRIGGSTGSVSVDYATSDGSATGGEDYATTIGTLTFADSETQKTFDIPVFDDTEAEGDETVLFALTNPTGGATLGTPNTAIMAILNVPARGSLQLSSATYVIAEDGGSATITVTRSDGSEGAVAVDYATSDGTATAGSDYTAVAGTLNFADGVTSQSFVVQVLGDAEDDDNESVVLTLNNPAGEATLGKTITATLTIANAGAPTLSISSTGANEGNTGNFDASVLVSLSAPTAQTVTVTATAADGTATIADNDYVATSVQLTFPPGTTEQEVLLPIVGDTNDEPAETILVNLSEASNAEILDGQGVVTIFAGDAPPATTDLTATLTVTPDPVAPGGTLTYTLTVSNPGPDSASLPTYNIQLPAGIAFASLSPTGHICTTPSVGASGTISCREVFGIMNPGTTFVTVTATVPANAAPGTVFTASGSVTSNTGDPNTANNTSPSSVTILGPAFEPSVPVPSLDRFGQLLIALLVLGFAAVNLRRSSV